MVVLLAVVALCSIPFPGAAQVVLDIDPRVADSPINLELWNRIIVPIHDRLSRPYPLPSLKIQFASSSGGAFCGTIALGYPPSGFDPSDLSDAFYHMLTHDYGHAKQCPVGQFDAASGRISLLALEAEAEALADATYREFSQAEQRKSLIGATLNNLPVLAAGGGRTFYNNLGVGGMYDSAAFALERTLARMPGPGLSAFFHALGPGPVTIGQYLQALDSAAEGRINGRLPSTSFLRTVTSFFAGPDGTFFAVCAYRILGVPAGNTDFTGVTRSVINPNRVQFIHIMRIGGEERPKTLSGLHVAIRNPDGRKVEKTFDLLMAGKGIEAPLPSLDAAEVASWPDGVYRVEGCVLDGSACDPQRSEFAYIIVYHPAETHNKMFLITTGSDYSELQPETNITLTLPPGATAEYYPHLIVINGTEGDVLATDGVRNRVFTLNGDISIVNYFVDRFQPYLYNLTNGASFNAEGATTGVNTVVPGSIVSLFSWGATDRDPESAQGFGEDGRLPSELCKEGVERTRVIFTRQDGSEVAAPFFYCSQRQLNVQVPFELRGSTQATVAIDFNGKRSNAVSVNVAAADPGIFKIFDSRGFGAIIHLDGTLVDEQRPAVAGETLSLYATGFGAVTPEFAESGKPAPSGSLHKTVTTPGITIAASQCVVSFSGLAPGYVGLYQVNFAVPSGLASGPQKLTLQAGGAVSNNVNLYVQ